MNPKEKIINGIFQRYKSNLRTLKDDYDFPSVTGVDFSRIAVTSDKSRNVQEDKIINYADKKTKLYGEVFIVEETVKWFELEGHGRERFINYFLIGGHSWISTEMHCGISRDTLARWRKEVFEKAETVGKWIGFFEKF